MSTCLTCTLVKITINILRELTDTTHFFRVFKHILSEHVTLLAAVFCLNIAISMSLTMSGQDASGSVRVHVRAQWIFCSVLQRELPLSWTMRASCLLLSSMSRDLLPLSLSLTLSRSLSYTHTHTHTHTHRHYLFFGLISATCASKHKRTLFLCQLPALVRKPHP